MKSLLLFLCLCCFQIISYAGDSKSGRDAAGSRNIKAADFMDMFGANIHLNDNGYSNTQALVDAMEKIGFSRLRCQCRSDQEVAAWKDIAAKAQGHLRHGLKADVLVIGYMDALDFPVEKQVPCWLQIADFTESLEGPNEINNTYVGQGSHGPADRINRTKEYPKIFAEWVRAVSAIKKANPPLAHVDLFAPSIASGREQDYAQLPDVSKEVDFGNIHYYAGNGREPSGFAGSTSDGSFERIFDWYKAAATPTKGIVVTEWGQTTAPKVHQAGCNEATQARYYLNQMCDFIAKGVHRAYLYQLMDDSAAGDPTGNDGMESHFGIFDYQWHPKPAAEALDHLKQLLADDSTDFVPSVPSYQVRGVKFAGAAGSTITISKSDGSTFIVVWNEPPMWDATLNAPIAVSADPVTVNFGRDTAYRVYDPLTGINALSSGQGRDVTVQLRGSPMLIQVLPAKE